MGAGVTVGGVALSVMFVIVCRCLVMDLQLPLIGLRDKAFQRENLNFVCVNELIFEATARVETAQLPSFAPEDQVGLGIGSGHHGVGETDDFKWHLLLR